MRVWVRNTGSIQVVLDQVYVNNLQTTVSRACPPGVSPSGGPPAMCPPGTRLSLPIQAVGALDVKVPSSVIATGGTATSGAATMLTDSIKSWTINQWANCAVTVVAGTGVGQTRTISSNTATVLTVSTAWTTNPDATSQYNILGVCSSGTYSVIAATTRGTTFQGSFTV